MREYPVDALKRHLATLPKAEPPKAEPAEPDYKAAVKQRLKDSGCQVPENW